MESGSINWMQIVVALLMGVMIWRMIPVARHWLQNGPKGDASQWLNVSFLIGGVVLFILLLTQLV